MFTANWMAWALGIAGSLGVVGLIVAAVFAPPLAAAIWRAVASVFMKLFNTRLGFGAIVGVVVYLGASWYQHRIDTLACEAKAADFKAAQKARDERIKQETAARVRREMASEAIAQRNSDHALEQFKTTLDSRRACRVGDDAPGLRKLWGLEGRH